MDLRKRRIPNSWILTGLILAFGQSMVSGRGIAGTLSGMIAALPSVMFYILHMLGAGDVKLLFVIGAFLGSQAFYECIFGIPVCALLQFFVFSVIDILIKDRDMKLIRKKGSRHYMPMAPAIFAGVSGYILLKCFSVL